MAACLRVRALDWKIPAIVAALLGFACGSDGGSKDTAGAVGGRAGGVGTGASASGGVATGGSAVTSGSGPGGSTATGGRAGGAGAGGSESGGGGAQGAGGQANGGASQASGGTAGTTAANGGALPIAGSSGSGQGTCTPGIGTGDACDPGVDTAGCQPSSGSCTCGTDGHWACTPSGGAGGSGGVGGGGTGPVVGGTDGGAGQSALGGTGGEAGSGGKTAMEWLPSWATSIQRTEERNLPPPLVNTTLRQFVWPTYSGDQIRIQLSNEKASSPVVIKKVHIAMAGTGQGQIEPNTDAEFLFAGSPNVTIPAGEVIWSDALSFPLRELKLTAVSIHFASVPTEITGHPGSRSTSCVASGDVVSEASLSNPQTRDRWYFINAIEVMARSDAFALSVLGDSITDGYGVLNEFARWTDFLTLAIQQDATIRDTVSVLNAGMGANALLMGNEDQDSGLVRFERDILRRPKVKWVIVLHGVNDIGKQSDLGLVNQVTAAYQQIINQGHEAGILVYGSPLLPFKNNSYDAGQAMTIRAQINDWVRHNGAFDAVIDLAEAVADPGDQDQLLASYSNDWLHPNKAGYEAMGNAVDLSLFYHTRQ